jgi:hypothetical protein
MRSLRSLLVTAGALALVATATATASASSGYVRGRLQFFQNQGGYCPASRDCTGARYLESQFHTYLPIADTRVWIRRASDAQIIGQGSSDADGWFTIRWSDPSTSGSVSAVLAWQAEHKDGRFAVRNADGQTFRMSSPSFGLGHGTTAASPTQIGAYRWGSSSSPHAIANVYDGATRMWNVLKSSNRMLTYFAGVEIRAFSSAQCGTSCASGKLVILDDNAAYAPQARVMHELGHVASTLANKGQSRRLPPDIYCFTDTSNCGWSFTSQEWQAAAFEEGLATFYGDVALYTAAATAPHTCYASAAPCGTGTFNVETSSRSACATGENRWALSTVRYLRDAYDDNADYGGETLSAAYHEFFDTVHAFDEGTWEDQKEEYWNADFSALDDKDGRSAHDFRDVWIPWGTDSTAQYQGNCSPVGD